MANLLWLTLLITLGLVSAQINTTLPDCPIPTCTYTPPTTTPFDHTSLHSFFTHDKNHAFLLALQYNGTFIPATMSMPSNSLSQTYTLNYKNVFANVPDSQLPPPQRSDTQLAVVETTDSCLTATYGAIPGTIPRLTINQMYCVKFTQSSNFVYLYDTTVNTPVGVLLKNPTAPVVTTILSTIMVNRPTTVSTSQLLANIYSLMRTRSHVIQQQFTCTSCLFAIDASTGRAATSPTTHLLTNWSPSFFETKTAMLDHVSMNTINQTARGVTRETFTGYILNAAKAAAYARGAPSYYIFSFAAIARYHQAMVTPYNYNIGRLCEATATCCLSSGIEHFDIYTWLFHYYGFIKSKVYSETFQTNDVLTSVTNLATSIKGKHSVHCDLTPYSSFTAYNLIMLQDVVEHYQGTRATSTYANNFLNLTDINGYLPYSTDTPLPQNYQNYMPFATYLLATFYSSFTLQQKFDFHRFLQSVCYYDSGFVSRNQAYHSICHIITLKTSSSVPYPAELQWPFTAHPSSGHNSYPVSTDLGTVAVGNTSPLDYPGICYQSVCLTHPTINFGLSLSELPIKWEVRPEGIYVTSRNDPTCLNFKTSQLGTVFITLYDSNDTCTLQQTTYSRSAVLRQVNTFTPNATDLVVPYGKTPIYNGAYNINSTASGAVSLSTDTHYVPRLLTSILTPQSDYKITPTTTTLQPFVEINGTTFYYDSNQAYVNTSDVYQANIDFGLPQTFSLDTSFLNCTAFLCASDYKCIADFLPICTATQPLIDALLQTYTLYNQQLALYNSSLLTIQAAANYLYDTRTRTRRSLLATVDLGYGNAFQQPAWVYEIGATAAIPMIGPAVSVGLLASRVATIESTLYQITQGVKESIIAMNTKLDKIANILHSDIERLGLTVNTLASSFNTFTKQVTDKFASVDVAFNDLSTSLNTLTTTTTVGASYAAQINFATTTLTNLEIQISQTTDHALSCIAALNEHVLSPNCISVSQLSAYTPNALSNIGEKLVLTHYINGSLITFYHLIASKGVYRPLPKMHNSTHHLVATTGFYNGHCIFCGEHYCDISVSVPCDYAYEPLKSTVLAAYPLTTGVALLALDSTATNFIINYNNAPLISSSVPQPPIINNTDDTVITLQQQIIQLQTSFDRFNISSNFQVSEIQPIIDYYNAQINSSLNQIVDFGNGSTSNVGTIILIVLVVALALAAAIAIICGLKH